MTGLDFTNITNLRFCQLPTTTQALFALKSMRICPALASNLDWLTKESSSKASYHLSSLTDKNAEDSVLTTNWRKSDINPSIDIKN